MPDFSNFRNDLTQLRNDTTASATALYTAVQPSHANSPTTVSVQNEWSKAFRILADDWSKTWQAFVQVESAALATIQ